MLARAIAKYIRVSPRKVRDVMNPLRHRSVAEALALLAMVNRRATHPLAKAIASAFANARQVDPTLSEDQVVISRLVADGGPVWKRFRAAAFGRAVPIRKPTSHLIVELERKNGTRVSKPKPGTRQQPAAATKGRPSPVARREAVKPTGASGSSQQRK